MCVKTVEFEYIMSFSFVLYYIEVDRERERNVEKCYENRESTQRRGNSLIIFIYSEIFWEFNQDNSIIYYGYFAFAVWVILEIRSEWIGIIWNSYTIFFINVNK